MNATGSGPIFDKMLECRKIVLRELWGAEKQEQVKAADSDEARAEIEQKNYDFEEEVAMWAKYPRAK